MEGFRKVPSVLKILLIEIFAVFLFPVFVSGAISEIRPGTLVEYHDINGVVEWGMSLIGPILVGLIIKDIVWPKIKIEGWFPYIGSFDFCSTHPSYVLIDLHMVAYAVFFVWLGSTASLDMFVFWMMLATALFILVARLFVWYFLGRKLHDVESEEAYKPVLWVCAISSAIFIAGMIGRLGG